MCSSTLSLFLRLFFLEKNLFLQNKRKLGIELFFVKRTYDCRVQLLDRSKHFGIDIEGDKMNRKLLLLSTLTLEGR